MWGHNQQPKHKKKRMKLYATLKTRKDHFTGFFLFNF